MAGLAVASPVILRGGRWLVRGKRAPTLEPAAQDVSIAAAAYPDAGETRRLRAGRLRFFRTIAESVGVQGPTAGVVIAPAVLASISGGGTALVELVAAVAMGFVAYAFVIFTRGFNSAGSVYGFTGAVAGPVFGFVSAWALMLVYASFAGGLYAVTADEAQPAFGTVGLHLSWQAYAIIAFVLVMALAYLDIKISATVILALEGVSMLLVVTACSIVLAKGGFHGHAFSSAPFRPGGVSLPVLGLGIVLSFSTFSGFEAAATLGEESRQPRRLIPPAIMASLAVVAVFTIGVTAVVTNAYPSTTQLSAAAVPLVTVTDTFVASWMGDLVNFGAVVSAFGASLACAVGASRILFALGRDTGPAMLRRPDHRRLHSGRHRRHHLHHPAAHGPGQDRHSPHRPGRPRLRREKHLRPAARRPLQLGRARRRDHPGRRDRPAVRVPAPAARDRQLSPPQSRCQRTAQLQGRK